MIKGYLANTLALFYDYNSKTKSKWLEAIMIAPWIGLIIGVLGIIIILLYTFIANGNGLAILIIGFAAWLVVSAIYLTFTKDDF